LVVALDMLDEEIYWARVVELVGSAMAARRETPGVWARADVPPDVVGIPCTEVGVTPGGHGRK
jgi:hypothetical protein